MRNLAPKGSPENPGIPQMDPELTRIVALKPPYRKEVY
jgi:hypothetical protein